MKTSLHLGGKWPPDTEHVLVSQRARLDYVCVLYNFCRTLSTSDKLASLRATCRYISPRLFSRWTMCQCCGFRLLENISSMFGCLSRGHEVFYKYRCSELPRQEVLPVIQVILARGKLRNWIDVVMRTQHVSVLRLENLPSRGKRGIQSSTLF